MKNLSVTQAYLLCTLKEKNRLAGYGMEKDYLAQVYSFIQEKQPVKMERVVENFSLQFTDRNIRALVERVGASLEAAGCARRDQGGLFGGKTVYVPDAAALDTVVQTIRAELLEDGVPTEDIVALTLLLDRSGDLARYFSAYEKQDLKRRLKEMRKDPQNALIARVADYVEALLLMLIVAAT